MTRDVLVLALILAVAPAAPAADLTFEEALCLRRVVNYLEARDLEIPNAEKEFYARDSRVWFEEKKGPGRKRSSGRGPWADWDEFFNAKKEYLSVHVEGRTTSVVMVETNDFYALIDRAPGKLRVTWDFDDEGYVTGTLVQGMSSGELRTDRLDEFEAWAKERYPDELAFLMPDGSISPEIERAKLWKKLLLEWRRDVGLAIE